MTHVDDELSWLGSLARDATNRDHRATVQGFYVMHRSDRRTAGGHHDVDDDSVKLLGHLEALLHPTVVYDTANQTVLSKRPLCACETLQMSYAFVDSWYMDDRRQ